MQESKSRLTLKLRKKLKNYLNNKSIIDILVIGSAIKSKFKPNDLDLIVLFRDNSGSSENLLYNIKKSIEIPNLHIEPLFIDDIFKSRISSSIIHEAISLKHNSSLSELLGYKSFSLFSFSLDKLPNVKKVRFAQTLYGRNKDGLLSKSKGQVLGKGAFIIPVETEELFKELMASFHVNYKVFRVLIKN